MTVPALGALGAATFALALALCVVVRRVAGRLGLVDRPNQRSLHQVPVPRLGGVAIVVSLWLAMGVSHFAGLTTIFAQGGARAWLVGASLIAALGFVDDVRPLPALGRLSIQIAVALGVLAVVLRGSELTLAAGLRVHVAWGVTLVPAVLFVVATTNIYNFMDGMDGLAATQAMSAGLALGVAAAASSQLGLAAVAFLLAAASGGFFVHNAPPATLFLGDAGSTFMGFTFGTLAFVASASAEPVPLVVVPIALAPFLLDGSFTILRRLRRGERIWQAHRSHLYQRAVATGLSHRDVLIAYAGWCAWSAVAAMAVIGRGPGATLTATLVAIVPLGLVRMWVARRERASKP